MKQIFQTKNNIQKVSKDLWSEQEKFTKLKIKDARAKVFQFKDF